LAGIVFVNVEGGANVYVLEGNKKKVWPLTFVYLKQLFENPDIYEHNSTTHDKAMLVYVPVEDNSPATAYECQ
jgi:hypothetical protein